MSEAEEKSAVGLKRVCVIGAGPSGLSVLHAFAEAASKGDPVPEIVCYEKQRDWGGQWLYTPTTGVDQFGEPVHSSMYSNLWSNNPKESLEYPDYSFEEHFRGKILGSYLPRAVLTDYVVGRAKKSGFRDQIRFNHAVRWVQPSKEREDDGSSKKYSVSVENLKTGCTETSLFDYVIVAVGHFWSPYLPDLPDISTFPGRVIHARDFRVAQQFVGQNVCVVGGSYSGEDIACQLLKFGAKSVTVSYHTHPMNLVNPPAGLTEKPQIVKVVGSALHFKDDTEGETFAEFDSIIYCTGYEYRFPFLASELRLPSQPNSFYPTDLWKSVLFMPTTATTDDDNDDDDKEEAASAPEGGSRLCGLFYIGMTNQFYSFTLFDAQAYFIRDVILARMRVSSMRKKEMFADMQAWQTKLGQCKTYVDFIQFQHDYIVDLMAAVPDFPAYDCTAAMRELLVWQKARQKGILTFRDTIHTSPVTGNKQGKHHTSWWDATDDSMATYMK